MTSAPVVPRELCTEEVLQMLNSGGFRRFSSSQYAVRPRKLPFARIVTVVPTLQAHTASGPPAVVAHDAPGGRRQLLLAGLRRRQSGTLSSGGPSCCRENQHIRDHHGPRPDDGAIGHPHRGSQHLHGSEYRWTRAEVRRYEDGCCHPSQNLSLIHI